MTEASRNGWSFLLSVAVYEGGETMAARAHTIGDHGGQAAVAVRAIERRDAAIVRATVALVGCGVAEIVLALAARWLAR
jgi:hypothetical protein